MKATGHCIVMLRCIDSFEDIFGLSPQILEHNNLLDILKPNEFKEHAQLLNACFSVYTEMTDEFGKTYTGKDENRVEAMKKFTKKYDLSKSNRDEGVTQKEKE